MQISCSSVNRTVLRSVSSHLGRQHPLKSSSVLCSATVEAAGRADIDLKTNLWLSAVLVQRIDSQTAVYTDDLSIRLLWGHDHTYPQTTGFKLQCDGFAHCVGKYGKHLPDLEEVRVVYSSFSVSDLPMEYNPSDHPRASTIFLSKSQTDGGSPLRAFLMHTTEEKQHSLSFTGVISAKFNCNWKHDGTVHTADIHPKYFSPYHWSEIMWPFVSRPHSGQSVSSPCGVSQSLRTVSKRLSFQHASRVVTSAADAAVHRCSVDASDEQRRNNLVGSSHLSSNRRLGPKRPAAVLWCEEVDL